MKSNDKILWPKFENEKKEEKSRSTPYGFDHLLKQHVEVNIKIVHVLIMRVGSHPNVWLASINFLWRIHSWYWDTHKMLSWEGSPTKIVKNMIFTPFRCLIAEYRTFFQKISFFPEKV